MIRIALVDDHAPYRKVLRSILEKEHDLAVVGEAENGLEAIGLVDKTRPEVVLMDLNMPVVDGFDATSFIAEEFPATKVIALSMHTLEEVRVRAMNAGACHFLSKDCHPKGLITVIRNCFPNSKASPPSFRHHLISCRKAPGEATGVDFGRGRALK